MHDKNIHTFLLKTLLTAVSLHTGPDLSNPLLFGIRIYCYLNPSPAEPGYTLPLQTV